MASEIAPIVIKLPRVRLSFPNLFKPRAMQRDDGQEGEAKYQATFILDKKKHAPQIKQIQAEIAKMAAQLWKGKSYPANRVALHDGEEKCDIDGYGEEVMYIACSNSKRCPVVNLDGTPIAESDNIIYAGCWVHGSLQLWAQDNNFGKRINASLRAVMFVADGNAFGESTVDPEKEFAEIAGNESGSDDDMSLLG